MEAVVPRPAKFSEDRILGAASGLIAANGPGAATITAIGHAIGAPNGSIYHRFRSRDALLGRLWLQKAGKFQNNFADALRHSDAAQAARDAALSLPRSVRADFEGARILLLYRREDFLSGGWPPEMTAEAARLGQQVADTLSRITRRLFGGDGKSYRLTTTFAVLDVPFAAVRRHVAANQRPPAQVDALIIAAVDAILSGRQGHEPC
jgi:AcrR family transcriptional regulator